MRVSLQMFSGEPRTTFVPWLSSATVKIAKPASGTTPQFASKLIKHNCQRVLRFGGLFAEHQHSRDHRWSCTRMTTMTTAAPFAEAGLLAGDLHGAPLPFGCIAVPIETPSRIIPGPQPARSMDTFGIQTQHTIICTRCNCPPQCAHLRSGAACCTVVVLISRLSHFQPQDCPLKTAYLSFCGRGPVLLYFR